MDKNVSQVKDGYVWSKIEPSLLLAPRECPYCKENVLYRLCHWRVETFPFDYYMWGCAECGMSYTIAIDDETHDEAGIRPMGGSPRLVNARGQL